jgi:hypothetical protein
MLCSHREILIRTTALLKKFERHSNHLLLQARQSVIIFYEGGMLTKNETKFIVTMLNQVIFIVKELMNIISDFIQKKDVYSFFRALVLLRFLFNQRNK